MLTKLFPNRTYVNNCRSHKRREADSRFLNDAPSPQQLVGEAFYNLDDVEQPTVKYGTNSRKEIRGVHACMSACYAVTSVYKTCIKSCIEQKRFV
jgi:hypothetical protein